MNKKQMVLGFMFSENGRSVALIYKLRPTWQKDKINGIGGKVETFDKGYNHAMSREFREETGVSTKPEDWTAYCHLTGEDFELRVFKCFSDKVYDAETQTNEQVDIIKTSWAIRGEYRIIYNLRWLIPMALDPNINKLINIEYD
jgi:8-oxo-dGTP diphosphatase